MHPPQVGSSSLDLRTAPFGAAAQQPVGLRSSSDLLPLPPAATSAAQHSDRAASETAVAVLEDDGLLLERQRAAFEQVGWVWWVRSSAGEARGRGDGGRREILDGQNAQDEHKVEG